jgi:predicted NAD/FAD-dependent oxidoreductase
VHPALEYEVDSIHLDGSGPSFSVIEQSGRDDLVPLWTSSATVTVFSAGDGTFLEWSAEDDEEPWTIWPDFAAVVRYLLTDLYEANALEQHRVEIAALLLPEDKAAQALVPETR